MLKRTIQSTRRLFLALSIALTLLVGIVGFGAASAAPASMTVTPFHQTISTAPATNAITPHTIMAASSIQQVGTNYQIAASTSGRIETISAAVSKTGTIQQTVATPSRLRQATNVVVHKVRIFANYVTQTSTTTVNGTSFTCSGNAVATLTYVNGQWTFSCVLLQ